MAGRVTVERTKLWVLGEPLHKYSHLLQPVTLKYNFASLYETSPLAVRDQYQGEPVAEESVRTKKEG
jgi:hypothetical protein